MINTLNSKIQTIQQYLISGMTREEISEKLGYRNWHSLDIFMRRAGMRWSRELKRYYMEGESISAKSERIITLFNSANADPKEIAEETGFQDHLQMAAYMAENGFIWSVNRNNYVRASDERPALQTPNDQSPKPESDEHNLDINKDQHTHLLEMLSRHEDKLLEILEPELYAQTIPRYIVPGLTRTKSFYMSDSLSRLLTDFCNNKNLSQKEVIEAAIIEFLRKYSYKKEVDKLICNG